MKNFTKYLVIILSIFINFGVNAEMTNNTIIVIKTTSGNIKLELFDDKAPKTSENFKEYIKSGYFNNIIFHRVIKDFMIQGGGFTKDMQQKEQSKEQPKTEEKKKDDNVVDAEFEEVKD